MDEYRILEVVLEGNDAIAEAAVDGKDVEADVAAVAADGMDH